MIGGECLTFFGRGSSRGSGGLDLTTCRQIFTLFFLSLRRGEGMMGLDVIDGGGHMSLQTLSRRQFIGAMYYSSPISTCVSSALVPAFTVSLDIISGVDIYPCLNPGSERQLFFAVVILL